MSNIRKGDAERYAQSLVAAVEQKMYGIDHVVKLCIVALYCGGHVLLEGNPGLGKTDLVKQLGNVLALDNGRIQFTPDLMPSDITGTFLPNFAVSSSKWEFDKGPIFRALLLADEINRATPKTQAAMLQAMAEKRVTVMHNTYALPNGNLAGENGRTSADEPFMVLATQNPIDHEGTYDLPEAQADRFMFKILMKMPDAPTLTAILGKTAGQLAADIPPPPSPSQGNLPQDTYDSVTRYRILRQTIRNYAPISALQDHILNIYLASNHRSGELLHNRKQSEIDKLTDCISYGLGPRAARDMLLGAKAWGFLFVEGSSAADGRALANTVVPTLRHRLHFKPGWQRDYLHTYPAAQAARTQEDLTDDFIIRLCKLTTPKQGGYRNVFDNAFDTLMRNARF